MIIHKTFADFIIFLYVHISHSDSSYDPAEMKVIKTKMTDLFPAGTDIERKLYGTIREYNSFDKAKLDELFTSSIQHFKAEGHVKDNSVFTDIQDIIRADGQVNSSESKALETINKLISKGSL
jgi:uncharacterized tellurite resistance protein B-like protein